MKNKISLCDNCEELIILRQRLKDYIEELEQLRKEKLIWQKVCAYERNKWEMARVFPINDDLIAHMKNLDNLAGDK
jgi:hypothetical protein